MRLQLRFTIAARAKCSEFDESQILSLPLFVLAATSNDFVVQKGWEKNRALPLPILLFLLLSRPDLMAQ